MGTCEMILRANVQAKTDELFFRWFNTVDVQKSIEEDLCAVLLCKYDDRLAGILGNQKPNCTPPCSPRSTSSPQPLPLPVSDFNRKSDNETSHFPHGRNAKGQRDKENYDPACTHNSIRVTTASPKKTSRTSTLDRTTVPRFYFPNGLPVSNEEKDVHKLFLK